MNNEEASRYLLDLAGRIEAGGDVYPEDVKKLRGLANEREAAGNRTARESAFVTQQMEAENALLDSGEGIDVVA